jgi:hypothetical protein
MSNKEYISQLSIKHHWRYMRLKNGQLVRIDSQGQQIPRVRMRKKDKLKLRRELRDSNEGDAQELTSEVVENNVKSALVINPKTDEQLQKELVE